MSPTRIPDWRSCSAARACLGIRHATVSSPSRGDWDSVFAEIAERPKLSFGERPLRECWPNKRPELTGIAMTETPSEYDRVAYGGTPRWETHPNHIAALAWLHGLESPPVSQCRVLELGTG